MWMWLIGIGLLSGYVALISVLKGGLTMNNVTQAERNAIQQMDNQVYGDEAESYFENEEENDEYSEYDEDEQALERDVEDEQIRN
ncbi:hypothetical protein AH70_09545 [Pediococcus damnosus LMG 28219]|nr:hypothetical protein AH70_09545 [Pediococcus damnosus LMG 28219]